MKRKRESQIRMSGKLSLPGSVACIHPVLPLERPDTGIDGCWVFLCSGMEFFEFLNKKTRKGVCFMLLNPKMCLKESEMFSLAQNKNKARIKFITLFLLEVPEVQI